MNRRTDRAVAISALAAVVVVPTAIMALVKTGGAAPKEPGEMPPAAAAAQHDPTKVTTGSPSPGAANAPAGAGSPLPGAPGSGPGPARQPTGSSGPSDPGRPGPQAPGLRSFTRQTDVRLSGAANGDHDHATETATFTLSPRFAMSATGVRQTMKDGKLTKVTQKVIISGSTLKAYDGKSWERSSLTASQLKKLRDDSDPRQITWLVQGVPGMSKSGPDKYGSTHSVAKALMGGLYAQLPKDVADETRKVLPDSTGVALDLWSDGNDRPTWIGLNASAPGASFNGSMTFKSYR